MNKNKGAEKSEKGQTLPLFGLFITTLLLFALAVVDVGFFLHERQQVQAAADAAALAGAQELPDSPTNATNLALQYLAKNDVSADDVVISFRCTSGAPNVCNASAGTYDTIVVTPKSQAPEFFGGVLGLIGSDGCWIDGCDVRASAAGCRGACGPVGTGPADIMVTLDHSNSMSTTDLANAKNAVIQMFTDLNSQYQKVGLSVTPPVTPANNCDTVDHWADSKEWLPSGLTFGFQSSPHVLNTVSGPAYDTNCLDRADYSSPGELTDYPFCSCHTDIGSGIQAAANELTTNGRTTDATGSAVVHGLILVTDGAANVAPFETVTSTTTGTGSTSWRYCTTHAAVTSSAGDNNGYESSGGNGCASDNSYAQDVNSGTNTTVSCTDNGKDKHRYYNFGLSVPSGGTLTGIEVRLEGMTTVTTGTRQFCVQLSWDGGTSWTTTQMTAITSTSETVYTFGGSADLWGRTWTSTQLNNTNFRVRVIDVADNTGRTFRLDATSVKLHYSTSTTTSTTQFVGGVLGPCDWAMQRATAAKAAGVEIYTIGFGVSATEQCNDFSELASSPYYNTYSTDFLCALATDANHCYNEPKTEDLEPIFQEIAAELVKKGSRLVPTLQ